MAIIYSYPVASAVEAGDLVIGTDITGKQTKNFTLQSIVDLVSLQGLQSVLDTGTTWTSADGFGTFTIDPGNGDGYISYTNTDADWGYTLSAEEGFYFTDANGNEQGYSAIPGFGGIIVGNTTHSTAITSDNITANRNLYLPDASGTIALTSDINGTVGTIPVFTETKAIGDSIITQDTSSGQIFINGGLGVGTRVGIGTNYPDTPLHVVGEVKIETTGSVNNLLLTSTDATLAGAPDISLFADTPAVSGNTIGNIQFRGKNGMVPDSPDSLAYVGLYSHIIDKLHNQSTLAITGHKGNGPGANKTVANFSVIGTDNSGEGAVLINPSSGYTPSSYNLEVNGDFKVVDDAWFGDNIRVDGAYYDSFGSPGTPDGNYINEREILTSTRSGTFWSSLSSIRGVTRDSDLSGPKSLTMWLDKPGAVIGDSPIKLVVSADTLEPSREITYADNLLIGEWSGTLAETSNRTLQIGNYNEIGSLLGRTARAIIIGEYNNMQATATQTEVVNSAVIGKSNNLSASETLVVGATNTVRGGTGFVAGVDNTTSERVPRQFVIGRANNVDSIDTIVLGDRNIVTETGDGFGSMMVFGHLNDVKGDRILCLGTSNIVNSDNQGAYIIGAGSNSTADRTYSVGQQNAITGNESYAFGKSNTIAAAASVAVGTNNSISAIEKAYAFGFGNDNINFKSFAIGDNNDVLNTQRTYLIGRENKPATDNTIILGQFSDPTVLRTNNINGRSTVAFGVGVNNGIRRTAWEFRGKPTSTGDTSAGDSMQIMAWALLYSTSYADDTAAAAGGVEVGQLYRTGSTVKIRMT